MRRITLISKGIVFISNNPDVYISSSDGDVTFEEIRCKKIGSLGLKSFFTFDAENEKTDIFLVFNADSDSKTVKRFSLPEGREEKKFSISGGSLSDIKFDEYKKRSSKFSRMDGGKRVLLIVGLIVLSLVLVHVLLFTNKYLMSISKSPKTFEENEISITITKAFEQVYIEGFCAFFGTETCTVGITKEDFERYPQLKDLNFDEYCYEMKKITSGVGVPLHEKDGLTYIVFEREFEDNFVYHIYIFQTEDAYWLVQCCTTVDHYDYWSECFNEWAGSVEFK